MAANRKNLKQVEGLWDELIRHPDQFAGQRVRVTVVPDARTNSTAIPMEVRRWLDEGKAIESTPPDNGEPNTFGDALVEKFRKQGLVL